ncbi:YfcC family protein [Alkalicoccobacillus murimartini]|uniref:Ion transporter superfamily protein YfcC n=1 Tax=Alkalicoccobacillus murimartini TaxID=171685 RepID=A0ABT9YC88_9BACI|nr:Na+/H+ antiporter NhaC family protein [Alkalicoccobacillus murimartini]MDQ0205462.1 putative ion transporter superfamily protein YfcC [Alkalicoccobacillus murimartini]
MRHQDQQLDKKKSKWELPHTYALLSFMIVLAALSTYFLSAGSFERVEQDGRTILVEGSYQTVESNPISPFEILQAIPLGMEDSAQIIFYIFLIGGTFGVITKTGAIDAAVYGLVSRLKHNGALLIPVIMIAFSIPGATIGLSEEVIIFVPIGIAVAKALGYDSITGMSMLNLGAVCGFVGGMANPFTVGVAQTIAEVPLFSGIGFRLVVYVFFLLTAIILVMRYAAKVKKDPSSSYLADLPQQDTISSSTPDQIKPFSRRHAFVLLSVVAGFAINMYGIFEWDWYLTEMTGTFLAIGLIAGLIGGLRINGTFEAFTNGMKDVAYGALIVGFARAILVVMEQGQVLDTIVYQLSALISQIPGAFAVIGMFFVQLFINFFIPSGSGQAATTMPIMTPLADLLEIQRQVAVLAYQYGDGVMSTVNPTNGVLMACLALAGIPYTRWFKYIWKLVVAWIIIAILGLLVAVWIGLS